MRKEASLPIRLDTDISHRLTRAAIILGMTKSALIRLLITSFVKQMDANGGKITLPLQWDYPTLSKTTIPIRYVATAKARYGGKAGKRSRE
jgi:antitoxin component of RelBE/YafQ-DinJ toxin-antitoxin module